MAVNPDGTRVTEAKTLQRIRALAIPPAYTGVWISPTANGHIQATGRDARGRKQYRYHARWREVQDETKFGRMVAFARRLPKIRDRVEHDLSPAGLPRAKGVGYGRQPAQSRPASGSVTTNMREPTNPTVLTTLRDEHVEISGSKLRFSFRGKSGKITLAIFSGPAARRIVQRCQALPGEDLFQYVDDDGAQQTIGSGDVNDYLREISGEDFTAQGLPDVGRDDSRGPLATWHRAGRDRNVRRKSNIIQAIDAVAERLNNTRAVCKKYYVHPAVFSRVTAGTMSTFIKKMPAPTGAGPKGPDRRRRRSSDCFQRPDTAAYATGPRWDPLDFRAAGSTAHAAGHTSRTRKGSSAPQPWKL